MLCDCELANFFNKNSNYIIFPQRQYTTCTWTRGRRASARPPLRWPRPESRTTPPGGHSLWNTTDSSLVSLLVDIVGQDGQFLSIETILITHFLFSQNGRAVSTRWTQWVRWRHGLPCRAHAGNHSAPPPADTRRPRRRPERPASTPNELRDHRYVLESSSSVVTDTNVGKEWS